ncbi:MAG: glutathione S-transferase family protein [Hyphomicrobiaceae bacterium]|nr:MAG: glutathione S-transferase family protein [Hyphomicrobiaceae bacterium]
MTTPILLIANKVYSSWSMRPCILMKELAIPFEEKVVRLRQADTGERIREHAGSGKVPVLIDGDIKVWESIAICEYLAERHPDRGVWPKEVAARAHARAVASEMHADFMALRKDFPFNITRRFAASGLAQDVQADVDRINVIFDEARTRFGADGPFLYGAFSAADAMYAPVVARFHTYSIHLDAVAGAYCETMRNLPSYRAWVDAACKETWVIEDVERPSPIEDLRA